MTPTIACGGDSLDLPVKLSFQPTVIIDTREQYPLPFRRLPTVRAGLQTGDYSLAGADHLFAVERKSIDDLVGSVSGDRERFERELHRLRGFRFSRFLIVGSVDDIMAGRFRSKMAPRSILASVYAFEVRYGVPVFGKPVRRPLGGVVCPRPGSNRGKRHSR